MLEGCMACAAAAADAGGAERRACAPRPRRGESACGQGARPCAEPHGAAAGLGFGESCRDQKLPCLAMHPAAGPTERAREHGAYGWFPLISESHNFLEEVGLDTEVFWGGLIMRAQPLIGSTSPRAVQACGEGKDKSLPPVSPVTFNLNALSVR